MFGQVERGKALGTIRVGQHQLGNALLGGRRLFRRGLHEAEIAQRGAIEALQVEVGAGGGAEGGEEADHAEVVAALADPRALVDGDGLAKGLLEDDGAPLERGGEIDLARAEVQAAAVEAELVAVRVG